MKTAIVKRKLIQKKIKDHYKHYKGHKEIKLTKVVPTDFDDGSGCNWTIGIERGQGWEAAADFIRPYIIVLRKKYRLVDHT